MNTSFLNLPVRTTLLLFGVIALFPPPSFGQSPDFEESASPGLWDANSASNDFTSTPSLASNRVPRLRLFRIAPGFLTDPISMQEDDSGLPGVPGLPLANLPATTEDTGPGWLQVGMGSDNPNFDLRRPGDPGGFGYYRVNTQVSLLDSPTTTCTFGIQTVTPAGIQFAGMPMGPTVLSPAFSVFHAVNDRLAFQGFVSRNMPLGFAGDGINDRLAFQNAASRNGYFGNGFLQRNLQYGMAFQRPLLTQGPEGLRSLFFTVGALGQLAADRNTLRLISNYDVLPGLQWHVNDNWWMSSALLVPLGSVRAGAGQWQLTCSLRF